MNLAWLAAVLQPQDVAPHPNFADDSYDGSGPARLAAIVLGDLWRSRRAAAMASGIGDDDPVTLAERCLRTDTIAVSVPALANRLVGARPDDPAQATALALIVCSAAAELDDYGTCFQVLDNQLRWISDTHVPDEALLRAALLQQKALRLRDAGQAYLPVTREAATALSHVDIEHSSSFPTSPGVSRSSRTTLEEIRKDLRVAAASLIPADATDVAKAAGLPMWQELVRGSVSSVSSHTAINRAAIYSDYVRQVFARKFQSHGRSIGGPARADLFYSVLAFELLGHGNVYSARKELALLRLVQPDGEPEDVADALRLLRHATARNELDLALQQLRAAGPLSVLSHDARQILQTRTAPELLRTVEMRVLHTAADLLAPPEARVALNAVRAALTEAGPQDLPGQWELLILRKEVAWVTAAALGNASGAAGEVASFVLEEAAKHTQDEQLLDRALMRALAEIDWVDVPQEIQSAWLDFLGARSADLPGTTELVFTRLVRPVPSAISSDPLDSLRHQINTTLRGGSNDPALMREGIPLIRESLVKIRSNANRGIYSFGGFSIADAAVGLVLTGRAGELWPELTDFLLDSAVARQDRTPAFERLSRSDLQVPEEVRARFRDEAQPLLSNTGPGLLETPLIPYPAALRFLGSHQLIDPSYMYDQIASLAGAVNPEGRREAAATVAILAMRVSRDDLLALALPFTHDSDVEVRANAARALALMTRSDHPLAAVAGRRLIELLRQDGVLVPLHVLHALSQEPEGLPVAVLRQVEDLAGQHPARSIRAEAGRLLNVANGQIGERRS